MEVARPTDHRPALLRAFAPLFAAHALLFIMSVPLLAASGVAVSPESWGGAGLVALVVVSIAGCGFLVRHEQATLGALAAAAFVAMPPGLAIFSYATAALGASLPLQDASFARIDAAMGFDWLVAVSLTNESPWLVPILRGAYDYTLVAVIYAFVMLAITRQTARILELAWGLMLTCIVASIVAGLLPAVGAYIHHAPAHAMRDMIAPDAGVWHLAHYEALRAGAFRVFDLRQTEGIITFPSYHTACALLVPLALRAMGVVTALAWAFAVTVMVSTIPIGGHYLIDVIAGAAMTLLVVRCLRRARWTLALDALGARPQPA